MNISHFVVFLATIFLPFTSSALKFEKQEKFTLDGEISISKGSAILHQLGQSTLSGITINGTGNPTEIIDGNFHFEGVITGSVIIKLFILSPTGYSKISKIFYLKSGLHKVKIDSSSGDVTYVTRTPEDFQSYSKEFSKRINKADDIYYSWIKNMSQLRHTNDSLSDKLMEDSMLKIRDHIFSTKDSVILNLIKEYPNSQTGLWLIAEQFFLFGFKQIYLDSWQALSKNIKSSHLGVELHKHIMAAGVTAIGTKFVNLNVLDHNFKPIVLKSDSHVGELLFYDFWFSSCGPCLEQFPHLSKIYLAFRNRGFNIIGISIDKKEKFLAWQSVISQFKLSWPQFLDEGGKECLKLSINTFPTNLLLTSTGKILAKNLTPSELESYLSDYYK